jgi:hypothetical protein
MKILYSDKGLALCSARTFEEVAYAVHLESHKLLKYIMILLFKRFLLYFSTLYNKIKDSSQEIRLVRFTVEVYSVNLK